MFSRHSGFLALRLLVAAAVLATGGWLAGGRTAATELDKLDTSLKLIPEDAAFYSSILHGRELVEVIGHSNAWSKVVQLPFVQMGLGLYKNQLTLPSSNVAKFEAFRKSDDGQKLFRLLGEMASHEMFVYGDQSQTKFVELMQDLAAAVQSPQVMYEEAIGRMMVPGSHDARARAMLETLARDLKLIGVPNVVFGFKLKNTATAVEQLTKLEKHATKMLAANEFTRGHFKKRKVDGVDYLVLDLDGSMIPWDEMPGEMLDKLKESEAEEGDVQKIIDRLKTCKLVVALGVRDDYVLLSIGSSLYCLRKLGKGPRLIDTREMKPLEKHVDKHLVAVSYMSREMSREVDRQRKNLRNMLESVENLLAKSDLGDEHKERIRKDLRSFVEDLKQYLPEPGARVGVSFLCRQGIEGYQYTWGRHGRLDGSKPLSLLQHAGGNPIFGLVARQKVDLADYDTVVKWVKTAYGYFHEFALPNLPDREKAEKFLTTAIPLFDRLDRANREMLIPALKDGQMALVIDRKLASKQFVDSQPATEKPMPMIEPALVIGVSDSDLLKKAMGEYRAVINGLIAAMRQADETSEIPENAQIPEPKVKEVADGKLYSFSLPEDWPVHLDKQIVPNMGIGEHIAVASISHGHSERLLKPTPLGVGGVLKDPNRPLACALWLDWAAIVETASPWVDYIVDQTTADSDQGMMSKALIESQVHTVTDVLKVLRNFSNVTYFEDGVMVNHGLAELRDIEK
jgi:hypothetical protein